jgi:hypothetical protein
LETIVEKYIQSFKWYVTTLWFCQLSKEMNGTYKGVIDNGSNVDTSPHGRNGTTAVD